MSKFDKITEVAIGDVRIVVDVDKYTSKAVKALDKAIREIRQKHSIYAKHPMLEGESREEWADRIRPELEAQVTRKAGESEQDHLNRLFNPEIDPATAMFEILEAISESLGLRSVPKEVFDESANLIRVKEFIYNVLNMADIPADDFFPKRPVS